MRVIKWPRSHSHGSCVNKKGRGYKGFYSIQIALLMLAIKDIMMITVMAMKMKIMMMMIVMIMMILKIMIIIMMNK